ncbi:hypothetical protein D3C81_1250560 [compost metagenome]
MKINTISAIICWRCSGVHWVPVNQANHSSTPPSTTIINISARLISPPSANAPLAAAHIKAATGNTATMAAA